MLILSDVNASFYVFKSGHDSFKNSRRLQVTNAKNMRSVVTVELSQETTARFFRQLLSHGNKLRLRNVKQKMHRLNLYNPILFKL